MSDDGYEHPDDRRARRLAEAKAARHSPERLAQVAEIQRRREAEEAAAMADRETRGASGSRPRSGSGRTSAPRASAVRRSGPPARPAEPQVFGHPEAEWASICDGALGVLVDVAAEGSIVDPDAFWAAVGEATGLVLGDPRFKLPRLLSDVATASARARGLLLNALVVESEAKGPGRPFFAGAKELGLLPDVFIPLGDGFSMTPDLRSYWRDQIEAIHERFDPTSTDAPPTGDDGPDAEIDSPDAQVESEPGVEPDGEGAARY